MKQEANSGHAGAYHPFGVKISAYVCPVSLVYVVCTIGYKKSFDKSYFELHIQ